MGHQFAVLVLAGHGGLASEGRVSLENKALDFLLLVPVKKLWSPLGDCAMS